METLFEKFKEDVDMLTLSGKELVRESYLNAIDCVTDLSIDSYDEYYILENRKKIENYE